MKQPTFEIENSQASSIWAELEEGRIAIFRRSSGADGEDEVLARWDVEVFHNLLTWATQEKAVSAYFDGPLAHQIREHSKELGMTPEMFVWHAVKVFIEVGSAS